LQSGEGGAAFRKLSAHVEMDARLGGKFHSAQEFGAPKAGGPDMIRSPKGNLSLIPGSQKNLVVTAQAALPRNRRSARRKRA
jgi:hypothetical protein